MTNSGIFSSPFWVKTRVSWLTCSSWLKVMWIIKRFYTDSSILLAITGLWRLRRFRVALTTRVVFFRLIITTSMKLNRLNQFNSTLARLRSRCARFRRQNKRSTSNISGLALTIKVRSISICPLEEVRSRCYLDGFFIQSCSHLRIPGRLARSIEPYELHDFVIS